MEVGLDSGREIPVVRRESLHGTQRRPVKPPSVGRWEWGKNAGPGASLPLAPWHAVRKAMEFGCYPRKIGLGRDFELRTITKWRISKYIGLSENSKVAFLTHLSLRTENCLHYK